MSSQYGRTDDVNHDESEALLLRRRDSLDELPSPSVTKVQQLGRQSDYFWPAGIASLTVQTTDAAAVKPEAARLLSNGSSNIPPRPPRESRKAQPSRWATREFFVYYAVVIVSLLAMAYAPVRLSRESHPNYHVYEGSLSDGWIPGRKVDNSDSQVRQFRHGLPSLAALAGAWLVFSKLWSQYQTRRQSKSYPPPASPNPLSPYQRVPFLLYGGLAVLILLHGVSAFKILLILAINYQITKVTGSMPVAPLAIWAFNIAVLFANKVFEGYNFGSILPFLAFLDQSQLSGLVPRWHIIYNISMLRIVSFSMDWYWARKQGLGQPHSRSSASLPDYSWHNYFAYVLYPPLYIAGPIITFDAFMHQVKQKQATNWRAVLAYAVRFAGCLLTMEVILHYMYVVAIKDSSYMTERHGRTVWIAAWNGDTPFELAMISFWNLIIVWLKLLLPWRFFRLWSMMDGIDPPENMIRCVLNNYSTRGFWRSWHRSYNLWLLRYVYFPIGSALNTLVALFVVFTFVALWHDLSLQLLAWGWVITLFVLPEYIAMRALPEKKYGARPWYIHACALGGVVNIIMMITGNTIGFVLGVDHTVVFLKSVFVTVDGFTFLLLTCVALFSATHIMMEYREEELRRGINRKC